MYATPGAPERARWAVVWITDPPGARRKEVDCGSDFGYALRLYDKAKEQGKKAVTLRCKNMSFLPGIADQKRLADQHGRGRMWCPSCIAFRPFPRGQCLTCTMSVDMPMVIRCNRPSAVDNGPEMTVTPKRRRRKVKTDE